MRPFRFAIHLEEFGWRPTVLTIKAPGQRLTRREADLLEHVDIIELESPVDRTTKSQSQLGAPSPSVSYESGGAASKLVKKLDDQFPIDTWLPFFLSQYGKLKQIVRQVSPNVIWATADPWSSLVIGRRLAKTFRLPFFPDFRDPWTLSELRSAGQWKGSRAIDRYFERKVVEDADVVVFQTPLVQEKYRRHYADIQFASASIPNSFDPDVFVDAIDLEAREPRAVSEGETLKIGFFGRFRRLSPAWPIIDVLNAMKKDNAKVAEQIEVHSFGPLTLEDEEYAGDRGLLSCFRERRAIPLENALSVLREFDILLVSTEPTRKEIIPAKVFEYMAAGRPILSLSKNPVVERMLNATGTGIQLTSAREAAALLTGCIEARSNGERMPIPFNPKIDEIMQYEARKTTRDLAALFDAVVEPTSTSSLRDEV